MNRRTFWMLALGLAVLAPASSSFAQERENRGGGFDPAQFREMMMNNLKERLDAKDDEWQVLQPKLDKLMTAQRESMAGRMRGFSTRGGGDRDQRGRQPRPAHQRRQRSRVVRPVHRTGRRAARVLPEPLRDR